MTKMPEKDIFIAIFSSFLMSMSIVITKIGLAHFPPLLFAALRFLVVIPFLPFFPIPKTSWKQIFIISLCWGIFYLGGIHCALAYGVEAGMVTILTQMSVFIGFLFSWLIFQDFPNLEKLLGTFIGICGIVLICSLGDTRENFLGIIFVVFASINFAVGSIFVKKINTPPLALNIWINGLCFPPMLLIASIGTEPILQPILTATINDWFTIIGAGIFSTILGGLCWVYVLDKYPISTIMPFRLLIPVFGVLLSTLIFTETYEHITWVGSCLVLLGLVISQTTICNSIRKTFNCIPSRFQL